MLPDFEHIINTYGKRIYFVARRIVAAHEDAADVVQNVWIKVWQALDTFRCESELYTWLYRITVNESLSHLRARRKKMVCRPKFFSPRTRTVDR